MQNDLSPETLAVMRKIDVATLAAAPPRLLVMVYTYRPNHATACRAQYESWGQRVASLRFCSDHNDLSLPVVKLPFDGPESYENLWRKVVAMVRFAQRFLRDEFDWFMLGGDDMYLIPENLLRSLAWAEIAEQDARGLPLYLGRRFVAPGGRVFNSGGAGYLINRPALDRLIEWLPQCDPDRPVAAEDRMMGAALERAGVDAYDTRDSLGAERFHPFPPAYVHDFRSERDRDSWFVAYTRPFDRIEGIDGISKQSVSFHYIDPQLMRQLDSLVRSRIRPAGL